MRISSAGLALLAAVTLAACGGSGSTTSVANNADRSGTPSTTTGGSAGPTATATVTHTETVPAATSGTTGPGGSGGAGLLGTSTATGAEGTPASPCVASGLALSFLGGEGATGHGELGFALRNTGSSACSVVGYPGVQFLDRDGAALPTNPTHTTDDFFGHTAVHLLTVAPGQSVSFRLGVTHGVGSGTGCTTAYAVQVIAPNDTATLRVALSGGAAECGTATVSPVQAGDSAYR
jgi:hypothetical protein